MLKVNTVYTWNCMKLMKRIDDASIDFIICDLPYGISKKSGYVNNSPDKTDYIKKYGKHKIDFGKWDTKEIDLTELAIEYYRILRDGGVALIFYDIWGATKVKEAFSKFKQHRILEWLKTNPVPINTRLNFLSNCKEFMFSFVKKSKPTFNAHYHKGLFEYPIVHGKERTVHPTQKPVKLFKDLIQIYTNEGDLVLDNCAGSCTTAVAATELNRKWICIERDKTYAEIGKKRIKELLAQK